MKILNRKVALTEIPSKIVMMIFLSFRIIKLFKRPVRLLFHYYFSKILPEQKVELRDGTIILLSSYPHDLITIMVIFGKREYGNVPFDGTVLDIGANIGTYSIFAKLNGAKHIIAIEPNLESFKILEENISQNEFNDSIIAINLAVSDLDDTSVFIPISSNPNNSIINTNEIDSERVSVKTITMNSILNKYELPYVDLMKIDCEGAEYGFIGAGNLKDYNKIERIRLEYHNETKLLTKHLSKFGYKIEGYFPDNQRVGRIFYCKIK